MRELTHSVLDNFLRKNIELPSNSSPCVRSVVVLFSFQFYSCIFLPLPPAPASNPQSAADPESSLAPSPASMSPPARMRPKL